MNVDNQRCFNVDSTLMYLLGIIEIISEQLFYKNSRLLLSEATAHRRSVKKLFWKHLEILQENTSEGVLM